MNNFLVFAFYFGYVVGPFAGIYAAVVNGSFINALLSLFVPWYGLIYWLLT